MEKPKEFYVREVRAQRRGPPLVIGVPSNGVPIRIGDVFTVSYRVEQTRDDILAEKPAPPPTDLAEVALTVVSIRVPQSSVDVLPAGHTGALLLAGSGVEMITEGRFFRT